jgi:hypothetical protein
LLLKKPLEHTAEGWIPLDDHIITKWLHFIKEGKRELLDEEMSRLNEVWLD